MPTIAIKNQFGAEIGTLELSEKVFAAPLNNQAVYDVVNSQRAGMRQGTADTKNRTEVRGGGRKPWRQKGTGRARQGSIRSPQWRGGGIVFGPTPRKYVLKVNKKLVKVAIRNLLTNRYNTNNLVVVDKIALEDFKTKSLVEVLNNLSVMDKKVVVITLSEDYSLSLAGRNIPNVYVQTKDHLSVYDLINADMYVAYEEVIKAYEEDLQ